ncbi:MAG: cyclic nucleotide-binding domain-containing protein [Actinomycetota bacterium]
MATKRIESSVTSVSWIPMDAPTGMSKLAFQVGFTHYDEPPPDAIEGTAAIDELREADRFRFCNDLRAWIEVEDGSITGFEHAGRGHIGSTTVKLGPKGVTFPAVPYPDMQPDPEVRDDSVTFVQTAGGRTGVPAPRTVKHPPFVQIAAPTAWTTLALTIRADGSSEHEVRGASSFPRHWVYDREGKLAEKTATIEFKEWWKKAFGKHSPWGDSDQPAIISAVETAVERQLSSVIIGAKPEFRKLKKDDTLVEQGEEGDELFLLFDGVMRVEVDGEPVTEFGPGAILGEMAIVGEGKRTATLRAVTDCRIAAVPGDRVDRSALEEVARARRGEG